LDEATSPNKVSFWDPVLRQPLTNHANVSDFVRALSFSPDGGTLAVGIRGGILELIDVASKTSFLATNLVDNVAWSPADGALAVSGKTEWISLFDIATRRISRRLQMPGAGARYAACSPDGKTMAVFYTTTRIKLCNLATGREVATLHGHEAWGMHLAFSHDGQTLATASHDSTARLWRAPRE
jgi:WD40 repeat protein